MSLLNVKDSLLELCKVKKEVRLQGQLWVTSKREDLSSDPKGFWLLRSVSW